MCGHYVASGEIQPSFPEAHWQLHSSEVHVQNVSSHGDTAASGDTVGSAAGQVYLQLLSSDGENPPPVPRRCDAVLAGTQRSA